MVLVLSLGLREGCFRSEAASFSKPFPNSVWTDLRLDSFPPPLADELKSEMLQAGVLVTHEARVSLYIFFDSLSGGGIGLAAFRREGVLVAQGGS